MGFYWAPDEAWEGSYLVFYFFGVWCSWKRALFISIYSNANSAVDQISSAPDKGSGVVAVQSFSFLHISPQIFSMLFLMNA